jgi:hypothetical protein
MEAFAQPGRESRSVSLPSDDVAADLEQVLSLKTVTFAVAARFVLPSVGEADPKVKPEDAYATAEKKGYLPKGASPGGFVTWGTLSFLVAKAFHFTGGIEYQLAPSPRTAYRELIYGGYIQGPSDMNRKVTGVELMQLISRMLEKTGDGNV